jgi:NAD(P)-dependent dehydrogenase (short-subunit alcohol dehydrogenase family)
MKKVIVTGGASGMGRATAVMLAQNGYKVYSLDISSLSVKSCAP